MATVILPAFQFALINCRCQGKLNRRRDMKSVARGMRVRMRYLINVYMNMKNADTIDISILLDLYVEKQQRSIILRQDNLLDTETAQPASYTQEKIMLNYIYIN